MHGEQYEITMGSDSARRGMYLELWGGHPMRNLLLEVFFSDVDGSFANTQYRDDVPPEVVAWFRAEAACRLPQS